jgi:hypothetical protein
MSNIATLGLGSIPRVTNWEYATAAARLAATGFVATDVGKLAKQQDNGTLWELTAVTPAWVQVGGGSSLQIEFTIGTETLDSIQVDLQVQDSSGNDIAAVHAFDVWLSDSAATGAISTSAPDGGVVVGSPGSEVFEYTADIMKKIVTDNTGLASLFIDESAAATWYLVVEMPDNSISISGAITFAV